MRERYERWLQILMMVSGFVLLIVCANVANLMLIRGMERRRQISVSMALVPRLPDCETAPDGKHLALVVWRRGGCGHRICRHTPDSPFCIPLECGVRYRPHQCITFRADPTIRIYHIAVHRTCLQHRSCMDATRVDPIEALRGTSRSTAGAGSLPRKTLVVFQAALSLVLLSVSGLLTAALHKLENENFGFDQDRRLIANINPRLAGYRTDQLSQLYRRIHDSIASIPGVSSVALCQYSPLSGGAWGAGVWVDGHPAPGPNDDNSTSWDRVTAGYFDVIGTPIIEGRGLSEQDTATSRNVAVINEAFARKFFKKRRPDWQALRPEAGSKP